MITTTDEMEEEEEKGFAIVEVMVTITEREGLLSREVGGSELKRHHQGSSDELSNLYNAVPQPCSTYLDLDSL